MTGSAIKRQLTKKMYALATKGDMEGAKKVELAEHNCCKKKRN